MLTDISVAGDLTSLFWMSLGIGRLLAVPIAFVLQARTVMAINIAGSLICMGAILFLPISGSLLWLCTSGLGLSLASFFPTLIVMAAPHLSTNGKVSGKVTSLFFVGAGAGVMLIPPIIGWGFEHLGHQFVMQVITVALVFMTLLFYSFQWAVRKDSPA